MSPGDCHWENLEESALIPLSGASQNVFRGHLPQKHLGSFLGAFLPPFFRISAGTGWWGAAICCKSDQLPRCFWCPGWGGAWATFAKEVEREMLLNQGSKFPKPSVLRLWSRAFIGITRDLLGVPHLRPRPSPTESDSAF